MTSYRYVARDKNTNRVSGSLDAPDRISAIRQLESMGLTPVEVIDQSPPPPLPASKPQGLHNSQRPMPSAQVIGIVLIAVLFVALLINGEFGWLLPSSQPTRVAQKTETFSVPPRQREFVSIVESSRIAFLGAKNDILRTDTRVQRRASLSNFLGNQLLAKDWTGTLKSLSTDREGRASVRIKISDHIEIGTEPNFLWFEGTVITKESHLYTILADCAEGDRLIFSGGFLGSDADDYLQEASVTEAGSMESPWFRFAFSDIRKQ